MLGRIQITDMLEILSASAGVEGNKTLHSHAWQDPDHRYAGDIFSQRWCRRKLRLCIHMLGRIQITDMLEILSASAGVEGNKTLHSHACRIQITDMLEILSASAGVEGNLGFAFTCLAGSRSQICWILSASAGVEGN